MRAHIPPPDTDNQTKDNGFEPEMIYLSPSEWLVMFEQEVYDELGINAAEFVRRYRAGAYEDRENPMIDLFVVSISMFEAIQASGS